jgi:hypothetical protein
MSDNEHAVAHQSQEKFQFYGVALAFTILGLSIQTATFEGHVAARICELLSWLALLISGLSGLSHLEWNPVIRIQMVRKDALEANSNQLVTQRNQGIREVNVLQDNKVVSIEGRIAEYKSYIDKLDSQITKLDNKAEIKYTIFKWSFVIGIALLAASRSITPAIGIVNELCKTT